jgi:hypothetical protein
MPLTRGSRVRVSFGPFGILVILVVYTFWFLVVVPIVLFCMALVGLARLIGYLATQSGHAYRRRQARKAGKSPQSQPRRRQQVAQPRRESLPANHGLRTPDGLWWWDGHTWQPIAAQTPASIPVPDDAPPAKRHETPSFDRRKWMLEYMGEFRRVAQEAAKARGETVSEEDLDTRARLLKEAAGNEALRERLLHDGRWKDHT